MSLRARLADRIRAEGPLPFEEFQAAALYDPEDGFFSVGGVRSSKSGDFLTSPEISGHFGAALAAFVDAEAARLPTPLRLIEVGAGSGSLLAPLIDALGSGSGVEAWAVEASKPARRVLADTLGEHRVVETIDELAPEMAGVVIGNELVDNIPVALARRRSGGWVEMFVGEDGGKLEYVEVEARSAVATWCRRHAGQVPDGGLVEAQLEAGAWLRRALALHEHGSIVLFDYGDTAEGLVPRRDAGTLRTYRAHHLGPDPLLDPGTADITVDVNFTALMATCADSGWRSRLIRQEDFLTKLGLRDRLREIRSEELELARAGDEMARLRVRSEKTELETLLHPRGLGDFRVLVAWTGEPPQVLATSQ